MGKLEVSWAVSARGPGAGKLEAGELETGKLTLGQEKNQR